MSDDSDNKVLIAEGAEFIAASGTGSTSSSELQFNGFPIYETPATLSNIGAEVYATVLSGSWVAYASNGTTLYSSGSSVVSGAINLGYGASLDIQSGAVVSGIRGGGSYQYPNITIESGGTLEHSNVENGYVTIMSGGVAYRNLYDSVVANVSSGGTSINDTVYVSYGYNNDPMTVYSGGTAEYTLISSGGTLIVGSGGYAGSVDAYNNGYISGASSSYISGYKLHGSSYITDYGTIDNGGTASPVLSSDTTGRTVLGGVWSAVEVGGSGTNNSGGTTVYVSGGGTVSGNVSLGYGAYLYVTSGATASNVNVASNYIDVIYVQSGGTLESSTLPNGYLYVSAGGASIDNSYNSVPAYFYSGATSIRDTFYDSGYPAGDAANVYSGATMRDPYISSGGVVSAYAGADVRNVNQANAGTLYQMAQRSGEGGTLGGGAVWSAVNSNGETIYVNGASTRYGNLTLGFQDTLVIMSGANVSNLQTNPNGQDTVIISSGGTLTDSNVGNATVWMRPGASASHNIYGTYPVYISSGAVDSRGTYANGGYAYAYSGASVINDVESGGSDSITAYSGATVSGNTAISGGVLYANSGAIVSGGTVAVGGTENIGGVASDIKVSSGGVLNFTGQSYDSANVASRAPISGLPTSATVLNQGYWSAVPSNGSIVYESAFSSGQTSYYVSSGGSLVNAGRAQSNGTTILNGDMSVANGVTVEVVSGATVSGLNSQPGGIGTYIVDSGGELESSYLQNGYAYISSGGTALGNVYDSTPAYISSGGVDISGTHYVDSGYDSIAGATVFSGGTITSNYISSGGTLLQSSGGTVVDPIIVSGGAYEPQSGGLPLALNPTVLSSGSWQAVTSNGTTLYESGTSVITDPVTVAGGATLEITPGTTVSGLDTTSGGIATINIDSGATLTSSYVENGYVNISSGGVGASNVYNSTPVYVSSGGVDYQGSYYNYIYAAGDGGTASSGGTLLSPLVSNGGTIRVLSGGTVDNPVAVGGGNIYINGGGVNTCFLEGTLIKTEDGLKPIENLRPGDKVIAIKDNHSYAVALHWVGIGRASFTHHGGPSPANLEDYPIRIKKDAFGDNVPFKDLLVTSEHCLYFEGYFVPVRMLVNGRSIFYDVNFNDYLYYHLETEKHCLISADGVLSESYLDTGNRATFDHKQYFLEGFEEHIAQKAPYSWVEDAAFPLNVKRDFVEPLYYSFEERAKELGLEKTLYPWSSEEDQNGGKEYEALIKSHQVVHLKTDKGGVLYPLRNRNGYYVFEVPANVEKLYIRSHIARPVDVIGAFVDDRRYLGVLVGEIKLISSKEEIILTEHLENNMLDGWSNIENSPCRWTAGEALISLPSMSEEVRILALQIIDSCC